jgi:hypothetical protein
VDNSLILWKHKTKPHFIIQICPAFEKWIFNVCELGNINFSDFELSKELEDLKKYTKKRLSLYDNNLKRLFTVISKLSTEEVRKLKGWVKILKEKNYQVEINDLKNV